MLCNLMLHFLSAFIYREQLRPISCDWGKSSKLRLGHSWAIHGSVLSRWYIPALRPRILEKNLMPTNTWRIWTPLIGSLKMQKQLMRNGGNLTLTSFPDDTKFTRNSPPPAGFPDGTKFTRNPPPAAGELKFSLLQREIEKFPWGDVQKMQNETRNALRDDRMKVYKTMQDFRSDVEKMTIELVKMGELQRNGVDRMKHILNAEMKRVQNTLRKFCLGSLVVSISALAFAVNSEEELSGEKMSHSSSWCDSEILKKS